MRFLARGEASLYGAIVMSVILLIFVSLYSAAVANLSRQGEAYREALESYLEASSEWIEFRQNPSGSIEALSNTDSRIVYMVIANSSTIINSSPLNITLTPGSPATILSGDLAGLVSRGSAFLAVFTSRGNAFIYRGGYTASDSVGKAVSSDLWASPLLAIARQMGDIVVSRSSAPSWWWSDYFYIGSNVQCDYNAYRYQGVLQCWFYGDESQGQVRVSFVKSLVVEGGATLYIANPTPRYVDVPIKIVGTSTQNLETTIARIEALGGVGVSRIIVADTIIINGTLSSRGLGGAGNILYADYRNDYYGPVCGATDVVILGDLKNYGNISSAGGGGSGAYYKHRCLGLSGGGASLYGYTAPGGSYGGDRVRSGSGGSGAFIGSSAVAKTLIASPYSLSSIQLFGAGGGTGGAGLPQPPGYMGTGGAGGRGGGGIVIICSKLVMNNGVIEASGEDGKQSPDRDGGGGGGGGAGAIFIYCDSIEGSGVIRALGGSGGSGNGSGMPGGRGGDGLVVIVAGYISPNIRIEVGSGYKLIATP